MLSTPVLGLLIVRSILRFWKGEGYTATHCPPLQVDAPINVLLIRARNFLVHERAMFSASPSIAAALFCVPVFALLSWFDRAYGWREPLQIMGAFVAAVAFLVSIPLAILDIFVGSLPQYYSTPPWLRDQRLNERRIIVRRLNEDARKKGSRRRVSEEWWIPWWARGKE